MNKLIVFDMDGTLTIVGDRVNCLKDKDWDSFYNRCGEDTPNRSICRIYTMYDNLGDEIVVLTGRRESCRQATLEWFDNNHIPRPDALIMRPDNDWRSDTLVKFDMLAKAGYAAEQAFTVFEDRDSMVKAWRDRGVTCLQVADGNF